MTASRGRLRGALTRLRGSSEPDPGDDSDYSLLLRSSLFDHQWYAELAGLRGTREQLVGHYLATAIDRRCTPQPFFDPTHFKRQLKGGTGSEDPFVYYLRREAWRRPTHPLFHTSRYLKRYPEAAQHPDGPIAHYRDVGVAAGLVANEWLEGIDLLAWMNDRRAEWAAREQAETSTAIGWADLATRRQTPGLTSVVIPTYRDWRLTTAAVSAVSTAAQQHGHHIEIVVWDNGSFPCQAVILDALPARFPQTRVYHHPDNLGFALGNNVALTHARGEFVVFLNNDTTARDDWLGPLLEALADPEVLGAQSLLVYPSGAIQSAGVAFPEPGGIPHAFLAGFPIEDASGVERLKLHALTGAALAMRFTDAVALRGFDPIFTNGMEDIDLCLRLADLRPGHFRVCPDSVVVHHESRTPGRYLRYLDNRANYLDRWADRAPRDDVALWAAQGFRVTGRTVTRNEDVPERLGIPMPVLERVRASVWESPPTLRWAIKVAAQYGRLGDRWGDTIFARSVADALRALGQEVVVDHRGEFMRESASHDDVALVIRGLEQYQPDPSQVSLLWVISHPELVTAEEAAAYDRVLAASVSWAHERTKHWGIEVEPLLQATDPALFTPASAQPDTGEELVFVGNSRHEMRPMVRDAAAKGLPLAVYGRDWPEVGLPAESVRAEHVPNSELSALYRSSGVVLNDHWDSMRTEGFLSNRLFDAAASGARVITDDVAGLGDIFGASVQPAASPDDLLRLATLSDPDAVFGDEQARLAVALRVRREHSFAARATRLLGLAAEAHQRRETNA